MNRKKRWWGIWARGAVTAFSAFVALDTFIIPAAYSSFRFTLMENLNDQWAAVLVCLLTCFLGTGDHQAGFRLKSIMNI